MIYRILTDATDGYKNVATAEYVRMPSPLFGAGGTSGGMMWELHSHIVYEDEWQIALLPATDQRRGD